MSTFACGRCDECDGGRGSAFCLYPRGTTPTERCDCGRVLVLDEVTTKRIRALEQAMEKAIRECLDNERGAAIGTLQLALEGR